MHNAEKFNIAVVGATGVVGETMLEILAQRNFPIGDLYPLASSRSEGETVRFKGRDIRVKDLEKFDFKQVHIALFSAGRSVSAEHAPRATAAGCIVIDNTSEFRYADDIPLVVPEVNSQDLAQYKQRLIIANPNCSTIQLTVALKPVYDAVGIERINIATYQSVSGGGRKGVENLMRQSVELLNGRPVQMEGAEKQIAFNAVPHIDEFQDNGYTREEMKLVWETRKILGDADIRINATAVRVPVFYGHSEAVHIETRDKLTASEATQLLQNAAGVKVVDIRRNGGYPTAVTEAALDDAVFVGRIREDISHDRGLSLWIVADNVRKGAALNSVQIGEMLVKNHL